MRGPLTAGRFACPVGYAVLSGASQGEGRATLPSCYLHLGLARIFRALACAFRGKPSSRARPGVGFIGQGRPGRPTLYGTTGSIPKPAPLFAAQPV